MEGKKGFDVAVGMSRVVMRFLGIWPNPKKKENFLNQYYIVIPSIIMLCFCNIPQTVRTLKVWGDLNAVLNILAISNVAVAITLLKYIIFWFQRNVLGELVISMAEDWNSSKSDEDLIIMWKNAKTSRLISIVIISLAEGTILSQLMQSTFKYKSYLKENNQYNVSLDNISMALKPVYLNSEFFYDVQKSPFYEVTFLLQFLSTFLAASAFSSIDAFFAAIVLHLCGQLNNLKEELRRFPKKSLSKGNEAFINVLSTIIIRHEYLERFANIIEDSFNVMFLIQMIISSIVLCLQGYQIVMITTADEQISLFEIIFMTNFTLCFVFSLFVYCYVAEVLQNESIEIGYAVYDSDWYNLAPCKAKNLLMVMIRVKQPFKITAGKFVAFSLQQYCSILKSTGGYLSMLLAMKNRLVNQN